MTFISLAQAHRQLGIDPKTLRRWLAQAQLPVLSHPSDHRLKGISELQVRELAQLHHRQLPTLTPDPAPTQAVAASLDPTVVLERLHELHEQIAAVQQQVAVLTARLQPGPAPTSPAIPVAAPSVPAPAPNARKKPAAKPKPKRVAVIPRVEVGREGKYVVICPKRGLLPFEPDTEAWFAWVKEQESFRFVGKEGFFTAHHEGRVPKGAWRAHRHIRNRVYCLRLAPNHELTLAVLEEAAQALQAHLN